MEALKINSIINSLDACKFDGLLNAFHKFDNKAIDINDFQILWDLPLESHGCNLAQKLRSKIQSASSMLNGVKHLDGAKYPGIAARTFAEAQLLAMDIKAIAPQLNDVYRQINSALHSS